MSGWVGGEVGEWRGCTAITLRITPTAANTKSTRSFFRMSLSSVFCVKYSDHLSARACPDCEQAGRPARQACLGAGSSQEHGRVVGPSLLVELPAHPIVRGGDEGQGAF